MILVRDIQRVVAEAHKVPVDAMRERDGLGTRKRERVWARQEAMFLCRDMLSIPGHRQQARVASMPSIGKRFGHRNHTTVLHALRAVEERIASDAEVRRRIDAISVGLLL